ncbi:hypothetical protein GCM10010357_69400 [Streptomyces luteireticuli]|uniref:Uncharacterized protein n=1 Tax=Streptomyces luteireticuli TaxID=173858 RepID=A0ABP3J460_9ACTN
MAGEEDADGDVRGGKADGPVVVRKGGGAREAREMRRVGAGSAVRKGERQCRYGGSGDRRLALTAGRWPNWGAASTRSSSLMSPATWGMACDKS